MQPINQSHPRAINRLPAKRRGTVIVLALAVLAILAIAAVAYVSVVRIDRESSVASAQRANYEQQVSAVTAHIGSLLAADLFGNKIVTNAVPQTRGNVRVWPRAFEDSESWDYPTTDIFWRNPAQTNEDQPLDPSDISVNRRVARPDDAWLAALEPRWNYADLESTRYWPQITNLRSAYTWNQRTNQWERGDGRYVDLLQWFLNPRNGRANAAINLNEFGNGTLPMGPEFGFDNGTDRRLTDVFDKQIAELDFSDAASTRETIEPSDERMWVDTDGDLRPDARWQQLDSLGNLFGLNWVVAARVIDASALINAQTAVEFPYEENFGVGATISHGRQFVDVMGTGKTPADVDLWRLLTYSNLNPLNQDVRPGIFDSRVAINKLDIAPFGQFENHLRLSLGVQSVFNDLRELNGTYPDDADFQTDPKQQYGTWARGNPLTRTQREALFSYATSTIERPVTPAATSYPRRDMLDLFSFYATNNASILSKLEQVFDGPETVNQGYLPNPDSSVTAQDVGPLRSAEKAAEARRFEDTADPRQPSTQRIKMDIRRHLTMVNGVGQISPVPVINDAIRNRADSFDSQYSQQKIRLSDLAGLNSARTADQDLVQRVFGSLVWALAPLATNQPLMPGVPQNQTGTAAIFDESVHYGGGTGGPSRALEVAANSPGEIGASYAILRAAAMTANLMDAMDLDNGSTTSAVPSVVRLIRSFDVRSDVAAGTPPDQAGFEVGTRLTQGDIPDSVLISGYLGDRGAGITLFGLDRQPFLREAHALAVYQPATFNTGVGVGNPVQVVAEDPADQLGSIFAFELGNPWPDALDCSNYVVRIGNDQHSIEFDIASATTTLPTISSGDRIVFYWEAFNTTFDPAWDNIRADWLAHVGTGGASAPVVAKIDPAGLKVDGAVYDVATHGHIPFAVLANAADLPVLLIRKADTRLPSEVLVDRMSPPAGATPFPRSLPAGAFQFFFNDLANPTSSNGTGRVAVASTLYRPTENQNPLGGFPGYVVERREVNQVEGVEPQSGQNGAEPYIQTWLVTPPLGAPDTVSADLLNEVPIADFCRLGAEKGALTVGTASLPPFQLFVPNEPLEYLSDVLRVSAYCHTFIHRTSAGVAQPGPPTTIDAWAIDAAGQPWSTFSEQLGSDAEFFADTGTRDRANRYLGVLDPSRFILSSPDMGAGTDLPDALTVPLATRVVEIFDALSPVTQAPLVQGRVNINTAGPEVLACLPLVAPQYNVPAAGAASGGLAQIIDVINPITGAPRADSRVNTLLRYRDRVAPLDSPDGTLTFQAPSQPDLTQLTGHRGFVGSAVYSDPTVTRGFVTAGELAILQPWDTSAEGELDPTYANPATSQQYMLQLGGDALNATAGAPPGNPTQLDPDFRYATILGGNANPSDDPEERLALYRAISNIVTTRSDVFIAWFVLRGYDPDVIESTAVNGGNRPNLTQARDAMNGLTGAADASPLRPTYESRWLVVYDRSNCVKPTDRPKILMQVELPLTKQ